MTCQSIDAVDCSTATSAARTSPRAACWWPSRRLKAAVNARYAGWTTAYGQAAFAGRVLLSKLADRVPAANVDVPPVSGSR